MPNRSPFVQADRDQPAIALKLIDPKGFDAWFQSLNPAQKTAATAQRFTGEPRSHAILPLDADGWMAVGSVANVDGLNSWCLAKMAEVLPPGTYRMADGLNPGPGLYGWITEQYRFHAYKSDPKPHEPRLMLTSDIKAMNAAIAEAQAVCMVRDLVNCPAEDMGPAALEDAVRDLAKAHKATVHVTSGDALAREYPMIHAVGRAAARSHAPRLIELEWGKPQHPRIALVGKGVCFDSGGLDIKPASGMLLMKKDMGGAAHAIALARLVMEAHLPVRLHLVVAAVENAISGNAFRPGDVLASRKGTTVEVENTDAEGRLVLGDALWRAGEDAPDLLLDFATLTGAARAALGPDLPPVFARNPATARALMDAGKARDDHVWEMPLWDPYRDYLKSDVADLSNSSSNGFAGAIVGALFLDRFVQPGLDWVHFDTFAWRPIAKPGRPKGGDALGLRAAWGMIESRYGAKG